MVYEFENLLSRYSMELLDQKGLSAETYRAYLNDIRHLIAFLQERSVEVPDRHMVRSYMLRLNSQYTRTSVNRKLSAIKGFFDFVMKQAGLALNPFGHVRSLKKRETLPVFLSHDEMFDLIEIITDLRDHAILELLYSTGIRVGEAEAMQCSDIDMASGFIRVTGKGSKQRMVPVGRRALGPLLYILQAEG
jgi:integrase/recombinase XerC